MERRAYDVACTHDEFLGFVNRMKSVFSQGYFIQSTASINEWYKALSDIPLTKLNAAFDLYLKANSDPPSVSQIRDFVKMVSNNNDRFNAEEYWKEHTYWVLMDLNGHIINECISEKPMGVDEVRGYFVKCGYDLDGTVLKPYEFGKYHPRYKEREAWRGDPQSKQRVTRDQVKETLASIQNTFNGIEVELGGWE